MLRDFYTEGREGGDRGGNVDVREKQQSVTLAHYLTWNQTYNPSVHETMLQPTEPLQRGPIIFKSIDICSVT